MKKTAILLLFIFLNSYVSHSSDDWGKTGHRATGEIAEKYLSRKARKEINKLLDGHSIAYVSNYGDEIKSDKNYFFNHLIFLYLIIIFLMFSKEVPP